MNEFTLFNIDTSFQSYQQIIDLYNKYKESDFEEISLSIKAWFSANLTAALGAVLDELRKKLNGIQLKHIDSDIRLIFQKNGFLCHFGIERCVDTHGTTIKYLKLKPSAGRFFHEYVVNELLNRSELPKMSVQLKKKITESIYEIFVNAQIHSESEFIYTCGQFYPKTHEIKFTVVDTGIGFKNRINKSFNAGLSSVQAICWAIRDGHSTKEGISGGIGLAILKEFIVKNKGSIQIISDDGFYQLDSAGETTDYFTGSFPGTIINMQFRTDDNFVYSLKSEDVPDDLF